MNAALIGVAVVLGYLLIGWVGAMTWMRGVSDHDAEGRGMSVLFGPPIGICALVVVTCDGLCWLGRALLRALGRTVPHGR